MKSVGLSPDQATYASLLSVHINSRTHQKVLDVFRDMVSAGVLPSVQAFNNVINSLVSCGDNVSNIVRELLFLMEECGVELSLITYNTALKVLTSNKCYVEVIGLFQELKDKGLQPDTITYNSVISAVKHKSCDLAMHFFDEMQS